MNEKLYFINSYKNSFLYSNTDGTNLYVASGYKDDFSPVTSTSDLMLADNCELVDYTRVPYFSWVDNVEDNKEWVQQQLRLYTH